MSVHRPSDHPPVAAGRIGVLLVNLGTPDATDYWSMRRYLAEFLSDRRVIEENRLKWWLVLNLIILSVRQWHAMRAWLGQPEELEKVSAGLKTLEGNGGLRWRAVELM